MLFDNLGFQPTNRKASQFLSSCTPRGLTGPACFCGIISLGILLTGCTTYTWQDGSKETVFGVPAEEDNSRYEEENPLGTQYRLPGEIPPEQDVRE